VEAPKSVPASPTKPGCAAQSAPVSAHERLPKSTSSTQSAIPNLQPIVPSESAQCALGTRRPAAGTIPSCFATLPEGEEQNALLLLREQTSRLNQQLKALAAYQNISLPLSLTSSAVSSQSSTRQVSPRVTPTTAAVTGTSHAASRAPSAVWARQMHGLSPHSAADLQTLREHNRAMELQLTELAVSAIPHRDAATVPADDAVLDSARSWISLAAQPLHSTPPRLQQRLPIFASPPPISTALFSPTASMIGTPSQDRVAAAEQLPATVPQQPQDYKDVTFVRDRLAHLQQAMSDDAKLLHRIAERQKQTQLGRSAEGDSSSTLVPSATEVSQAPATHVPPAAVKTEHERLTEDSSWQVALTRDIPPWTAYAMNPPLSTTSVFEGGSTSLSIPAPQAPAAQGNASITNNGTTLVLHHGVRALDVPPMAWSEENWDVSMVNSIFRRDQAAFPVPCLPSRPDHTEVDDNIAPH
jgi:hypothetical protein